MSAAQPVAAGDGRVIPLAAARRTRHLACSPRIAQRIVKAAAVFALCLLGLIGSFADSAVARTGLLLVGPADDLGNLDNVTATLIWATIANLATCAGVVMTAYWLLSRPSAQVVELHSRRRSKL
jgi:hypothetical protein